MENKNNNRVPTEQATHLISGMSNMETKNKTEAEAFLNQTQKDFDGLVWRSPEEKSFLAFMLAEFSTQQSKEKDERIKELEFANEEVRKKHDLARNLITDQDEEIKRLMVAIQHIKLNMLNHPLISREFNDYLRDLNH